jgi:hypothetical protein
MANILIHPNSGIIEFSTGTAGGGQFNPNFTGGASAARMIYDQNGGLNFTSYVSATSGLERFSIDGANGRLFSVTDNLSGSLFSVNDIAGLPVIEAFDNNTVIMGAFNRNDFIITGNSVGIGALPNTGTQKLFVSGNLAVSGALTTSRSKTFVYSGATRGPASRTLSLVYNNIAYGANCTITPRHRGTIKAEASVGLTVPSQTADTIQAATFWYGTGTPPVFSGNLNDLGGKVRIGGIKGVPQASTTPNLQLSPIGASWVAEVTGLTTGTTYWFDIAMSGRFLYVQDVQIYLEEIY